MKRRTVILSGLGALGALFAWDILTSSEHSAIAKVLFKRLDYLKLDPEGVDRFAKDVISRKEISKSKLLFMDAAGPFYTSVDFAPDGKIGSPIRHGEDRVVGLYLISSDFFIHGADESRIVRYVGYLDGTHAPVCGNPFARPVEIPV